MKNLACALSLVLSSVCPAHAESTDKPISVLKWFNGCALLSQPENGMTMDTNCVSTAVEYCTIGRVEEVRVQCLVELSEHVGGIWKEMESNLPESIGGTGWVARNYERKYLRLVQGEFDVCDASPREEIPSDTWCKMYLNAGRWVEWRHLQRLADEVAK